MTNEYATKVLKRIQYGTTYPVYEALDMAIEALNFVSEHHQSNIETYAHDMGVSLEQAERELRVEELSCSEEPNRSDLISRQSVIELVKNSYYNLAESMEDTWAMVADVERLPSAQPERRNGRWIIDKDCEGKSRTVTCNLCGHKEFNWHDPNYCPNCGADMRI